MGLLGGSVSQATDFGSGQNLAVHGFKPRVRLCAGSLDLEPTLDSVSPSLSAPPPLALSLSLSKINFKKFFKIFIFRERERKKKNTSHRGAKREGERESQAGSVLSALSWMQGSISQTVRS